MTERELLKLALEALENNRRTHHYCEDAWYSCPKHEDGCANDAEGVECNCGADKSNAEIDATITAIKEALAQPPLTENGIYQLGYHNGYGFGEAYAKKQMAQPEQEPVTWRNAAIRVGEDLCSVGPFGYYNMTAQQWLDWALSVVTVHAPPPQRTWVGLTEEERVDIAYEYESSIAAALMVEAKLREKNT